MSRYIDADALKRKAQKVGTEAWKMKMTAPIETTLNQFIDWIDNAPSIDIVRCKECKHNYNTAINHGKMQPRCDFADWKLTENDYCSRGERKEGE